MTEYRCYLMDRGHIERFVAIDAAADLEAVRKAEMLFASKAGKFSGFELWDLNRQVHVHSDAYCVIFDAPSEGATGGRTAFQRTR